MVWDDGDSRSYKKLTPALRLWPESRIITLDDDKLYPLDWVGDLIALSDRHPGAIVGHHGREMLPENDGRIEYGWSPASNDTPSERLFLIGCGGILYPPKSLAAEVLDLNAAWSMAPDNDDVWFFACSILAGTQRVTSGRGKPPGILELRASPSLMSVNAVNGHNDGQFQATLNGLGILAVVEAGIRGHKD